MAITLLFLHSQHSSQIIPVVAFVDFIFFFGAALPELANWRFASCLASADTLSAFILAEQRMQNATLSFSSDKVFFQRAFPSLVKSCMVIYNVSSLTGFYSMRYSVQNR